MRVERTYTDSSFHPGRRRVKYFPIIAAKDANGRIVNSEMVGDYPIIWSRSIGGGELVVAMLADNLTGRCMTSKISESDFAKLPETDIEW